MTTAAHARKTIRCTGIKKLFRHAVDKFVHVAVGRR
jgi:hypothetical protein